MARQKHVVWPLYENAIRAAPDAILDKTVAAAWGPPSKKEGPVRRAQRLQGWEQKYGEGTAHTPRRQMLIDWGQGLDNTSFGKYFHHPRSGLLPSK